MYIKVSYGIEQKKLKNNDFFNDIIAGYIIEKAITFYPETENNMGDKKKVTNTQILEDIQQNLSSKETKKIHNYYAMIYVNFELNKEKYSIYTTNYGLEEIMESLKIKKNKITNINIISCFNNIYAPYYNKFKENYKENTKKDLINKYYTILNSNNFIQILCLLEQTKILINQFNIVEAFKNKNKVETHILTENILNYKDQIIYESGISNLCVKYLK